MIHSFDFQIIFLLTHIWNQIDVRAHNTWNKLNSNLISNSQIKDNRLVVKNLNENDLDNFECISEHGYLTLHKQLRLDKIEFDTFSPKQRMTSNQYNMLVFKNNFKTYKNLFEINTIHLSDLSIYSEYLKQTNHLKLKCETTFG